MPNGITRANRSTSYTTPTATGVLTAGYAANTVATEYGDSVGASGIVIGKPGKFYIFVRIRYSSAATTNGVGWGKNGVLQASYRQVVSNAYMGYYENGGGNAFGSYSGVDLVTGDIIQIGWNCSASGRGFVASQTDITVIRA